MARAVFSTKERSGSRWRVSGVGTQMRMASGSPRRSKFAVASKRLPSIASAMSAEGMCLMMLSPRLIWATRGSSMSKPRTVKPAFAAVRASGMPT